MTSMLDQFGVPEGRGACLRVLMRNRWRIEIVKPNEFDPWPDDFFWSRQTVEVSYDLIEPSLFVRFLVPIIPEYREYLKTLLRGRVSIVVIPISNGQDNYALRYRFKNCRPTRHERRFNYEDQKAVYDRVWFTVDQVEHESTRDPAR